MAENRKANGRGGEYWDELPYEDELRSDEAQMPPRNILETDSAKYTAEFVKGVVKGLYTSAPETYMEEEEEDVPARSRSDSRYDEPYRERPKKTLADEFADYENEPPIRQPKSVFEPRIIIEPESAAPRERQRPKEPPFDMSEDELLAADGFLKAYEEKNNEKPAFTKKTAKRTFSSLSSEERAQNIENVLSGKPSRKVSSGGGAFASYPEHDEEFVYIKQDAYQNKFSGPERGRRPIPEPEKEERKGYQAVDFEVEQKQEKIPIIINRKIESKPKKTADEYRNQGSGKSEYDKPFKRIEPARPAGINGANVFAVAFMVVAIVIIGILVWKVNSLSKSGEQYDPEEVAGLREQNTQLIKENGEMETKYNALLSENEALREENLRLSMANVPETEPEELPEEEAPDAPASTAANGLQDGYYTVQSGDTLWKISEKYLGNGDKYLQIAEANNIDPGQPLYTGLRLKIPTQ